MLLLEWSLFVCWRHPSDSHLDVGVIISGLWQLYVCSLLPCVHSKQQFDVLQTKTLHMCLSVYKVTVNNTAVKGVIC